MDSLENMDFNMHTKDMNVELWDGVEGRIMSDGIHTITTKYTVGQHDFYLKTGWFKYRMVLIDITVGNNSTYDNANADLDITKYNLSRAMIELVCRQATQMLQSGVFSVYDIISGWYGMEGFPSGVCAQTGSIQKSPLAAAAVLIRDNYDDWHEKASIVENHRA